jgi:hypothetical protein
MASVFSAAPVFAAELSGDLNRQDIREALKTIGWGTNHRGFGAHGMTNEGLGLDVGFEAPFFLRKDLNEIGDGRGIAPRVFPVPRLWASWDFPGEFSLSTSFSPGNVYGGITTFGLAGQLVLLRDERVVVSTLLSYTYANAFDGDIKIHSPGLMVQISKDLEVWQPFAAFGFISSNGSVDDSLTASGTDAGPYTAPATHLTLGFRLDLSAQLVFQIDLIGTRPSAGFLFSHRF